MDMMENGILSSDMLQQFEELMGASLITTLLTQIPSMLINLAIYVFTALSLYTIAQRRGIHRPWLAWIPFANSWLLGCISDQYRSVARGETKNRRKVLLWTEIGISVVAVMMLVLCLTLVVKLINIGMTNVDPMYNMTDGMAVELLASMAGPVVGMLLLALVLLPLAIVYAVFFLIALHDIYQSCDPGNSTLYLVISIFINYTQPIFLFLCRNRDDGMPAKEAPQPVYYQPVFEQAAEKPEE